MELGDFQGELDYAEDSLFQAGLLQLKSETRERKEILSFSDFSTQVNVGEKRIYIYSQYVCPTLEWKDLQEKVRKM